MKKICFLSFILMMLLCNSVSAQSVRHTFTFKGTEFMLDGKPFQIISGEMHPARILKEYWRNRIQLAKAMGCNTIAIYIFWNYLESAPGVFDFKTESRNVAEFIKICKEEKMWVLFRPGPYTCAEWDFGGLPSYLLKIPDIKVRCMDTRYMEAVRRYIKNLALQVVPLQITKGGNIIMVQIENEYGSFGNDKNYLEALRKEWKKNGIDVPFYTADGPTPYMLEAGNIDGAAIGLDSGSNEADFDEAKKHNPNVPAFSSETYPGWLTHWGENWARPDTASLLQSIRFLMETKRSFNFYVIHGGTNFGFTAGANSGGKGYEPDLTSYDYDAPINEQGQPTEKYFALRNQISKYTGTTSPLPDLIPSMEIPEIKMNPFSSVWGNLPTAVKSVQPKPFEAYNQKEGFIIYKTTLIGHKSGTLKITDLHDYATVFVNGKFIGTIDRRLGEKTITIPKTDVKNPVLEIFVEGMGRINFAQELIDRKGITDRVTLNGMTLMNWDVYNLPFDSKFIKGLKSAPIDSSRRGVFFKAEFDLTQLADTYFDLSNYKKGLVWINGHNLGRYWEIGPQKRLYCPAPWLMKGKNEIIIFDELQNEPLSVKGVKTLFE